MGDQGVLCGLPWPVCPVDLGQRLSSRAGTAWCPSCGRRWPLDAVEPTIQNGGGKLLRRLVDGKLRSVQHAPQVGLEAFVVVGQELVGDTKQPGEGFAFAGSGRESQADGSARRLGCADASGRRPLLALSAPSYDLGSC